MKKFCLYVAVFFFLSSLTFRIEAADEIIDSTPVAEEDNGVNVAEPDYNNSDSSKRKIIAHKQNYLLFFSKSDNNYGRKNSEAKFQISVKVRALTIWNWSWYLAYSQKSFWQIYDAENSRPFRESNFNPETFIRSDTWGGFRFDTGVEHESNGARIETSRSWNRVYLFPYYENNYLIGGVKAWYRLKENSKENPGDVNGDDNPDIHKYYGYGELYLKLKIQKLQVGSQFRWNHVYKKGSMKLDLTYPVFSDSMYWYVQYWQGYGESLIDYNVNQKSLGAGLMFTL